LFITHPSINQYFSDAGELAEHTITVALAGADVNNNFLVNDHTITLGIDTELRIEGIDLEWYLSNHLCLLTQNNTLEYGRKFMSENGGDLSMADAVMSSLVDMGFDFDSSDDEDDEDLDYPLFSYNRN
jgi:hypothetical protein